MFDRIFDFLDKWKWAILITIILIGWACIYWGDYNS
jgi:hypothetical protein